MERMECMDGRKGGELNACNMCWEFCVRAKVCCRHVCYVCYVCAIDRHEIENGRA